MRLPHRHAKSATNTAAVESCTSKWAFAFFRTFDPGRMLMRSANPVVAAPAVPMNAPMSSQVAMRGAVGNVQILETTSSTSAPM